MAFFNDLGKKLSQVGQDAVKSTKDLAETTRLNAAISDEQKNINNYFLQLGKRYYELRGADPETDFAEYCLAVKSSSERIEKYRDDIATIKGIRKCPNCGADMPTTSQFCGACGFRTEAQEQPAAQPSATLCPDCGKEIAPGMTFCTGCGKRMQ